jgi:hypothetical protein
LIWGFVYAIICNLALTLSLGEIFAVYPTAGGQVSISLNHQYDQEPTLICISITGRASSPPSSSCFGRNGSDKADAVPADGDRSSAG